jgi:hypothetical protein
MTNIKDGKRTSRRKKFIILGMLVIVAIVLISVVYYFDISSLSSKSTSSLQYTYTGMANGDAYALGYTTIVLDNGVSLTVKGDWYVPIDTLCNFTVSDPVFDSAIGTPHTLQGVDYWQKLVIVQLNQTSS